MAKETETNNILVVSDSLHLLPEAVEALQASGHRLRFVESLQPFADIEAADSAVQGGEDGSAGGTIRLSEVDAVVCGRVMPIDSAALELIPRAKVLALHTSGTDNVDIEAATRRGIVVTNVKGVNAAQCADFAIGLMIASTRQILRGDRALRRGNWVSETAVSGEVTGATLGLVGLGGIGRAVAKRASAFDMELLIHTRTPDQEFADRHGATFVDLDTLLRDSDIVVLTASLTPATRGMIGAKQLRSMKRHAHLINVARGELVDESALFEALSNGWIAGAGIDVFEREPLFESPLFELPNVVLTPHQAGLTRGAMVGAAIRAVNNALAAMEGRIPGDAVNPRAAELWREAV